jgi:hypothetical protein
MWLAIFGALSATVSGICMLVTVSHALDAARGSESQVRSLRSLASRVESLTTSRDEMLAEMEKVAQSLKMSRVRKANQHALPQDGEPDPWKEPDRWRQYMNSQLPMRSPPHAA